ncbi:MAG TPA: pyrroloquinoline quinone biosynthesis protein PqqB [Tianweitania sediminis]|nr:pyrroloquinoline quinone biosynthesis protein PqqB [Tianweitania sediminis]
MTGLRFLVLGSAAGGGLPQWNCGCSNCVAARDPSSDLKPQTQSSLAVSLDGESWGLFNASPDIRQQLGQTPALHPRGLRDTPIESVVVTNGDIDHIAGLLTLREKQAFTLFGTAVTQAVLESNPVFRVLDRAHVDVRPVSLEQVFHPVPGLDARIFAVPGKVALFLEEGEPDLDLEGEQTVGIEMICGDKRAYYIPGCAKLPRSLAERLRGADLVFFDGTVFRDDEMSQSGTGSKTGRRMGHMPISGEGGSLEALSALDIKQLIYIHINNTNPIWRPGPERSAVEAAGFTIGHDGLEINLG